MCAHKQKRKKEKKSEQQKFIAFKIGEIHPQGGSVLTTQIKNQSIKKGKNIDTYIYSIA